MDKLVFNPKVAKNKPRDVIPTGSSDICPFCHTEDLTNILKTDGDRIWLMNKFRTLDDTVQTLIVESAKHDGDFSNYSYEESEAIVRFSINAWQEMIDSNKYQSVAMYKNYGPRSGGSLHHPHLQIVGFDKIDYNQNINDYNFTGVDILLRNGVSMNISDNPIMGFVELNIVLENEAGLPTFAKWIDDSVSYFLNDYLNGRCDSYNLFFYKNKDHIIAKIVPRFSDSPYFVGYKIPQVNSDERVGEIVQELKNYINKKAK